MSSLKDRIAPADPTNAQLRVILHLALPLVRSAAEIVAAVPGTESAFEAQDPERFHLVSAIEVLQGHLVGHGVADSFLHPSRDSTLGHVARVLDWTDGELERHFIAGLSDWEADA
jgi:hypothetical protein